MRASANAGRYAVLLAAGFIATAAVAQDAKPNIADIQRALVDRGYSTGSIDGLWGRRSINALAAFQKAHGLPATGELDRETISRLLEPVPQTQPPAHSSLPTPEGNRLQTPDNTAKSMPAVAEAIKPPAVSSSQSRQDTVPASSVSSPPRESMPPAPQRTAGSGFGWIVGILVALWIVRRLVRRRRDRKTAANMSDNHKPNESAVGISSKIEAVSTQVSAKAADGQVAPTPSLSKPRPAPAPSDDFKASLAAHNAKIGHVIGSQNLSTSIPEVTSQSSGASPGAFETAARVEADVWIPANQPVKIGYHVVNGGLIYVGNRLPQQGNSRQAENCLINPHLPVATRGADLQGATMGYWPSYSDLSAEARRSYIDWLAGPRSDPGTYIGYVFLYFYGLERRLMLGSPAPDSQVVIMEVRRLLDVYGAHHSFRRYAQELLRAHELQQALPPQTIVPDVDVGGYEVPLHIKAALGARVRDKQPIEPDLLLAYVMSHPETNVRTPAKRALAELRDLFAQAVAHAHPQGIRLSIGRSKMLKATYRACSGTFAVEIHPYGGELPDVTGRSKLLETGREIFNACVTQLDDYSRALGRLPGMAANLAAIARLPAGYRRQRAQALPGQPLARIETLAQCGAPCPVDEIITLVGLEESPTLSRAKLKDLAAILAAFGYGITADPAFAVRTTKQAEPVVVFPLDAQAETPLMPGASYRRMQAALMLGMLVAAADGTFDDSERGGLIARIDAAVELPEDERRRLKAELVANEGTPGRMADWLKLLKDREACDGHWIADMLVAAAAADGRVDPQEVAMLEKLFRRLGLDEASLYGRLHGGLAQKSPERDEDLPFVVSPDTRGTGTAIPSPPSAGPQDGNRSRLDPSRLETIRRETRSAAGVLADIFAEEEETPEPPPPDIEPEDEDVMFEGLERRYDSLLAELSERETWTAADFEHLTRDAGLMPGAARQVLNDWALDRFDELLLEGEDPIIINRHLLPWPGEAVQVSPSVDLRASA